MFPHPLDVARRLPLVFFLHIVTMHKTLGVILVHERGGQVFAKSQIGVVHELLMRLQQRFFFFHDSFMNLTCTVHESGEISCPHSSIATKIML